MPLGLPLMHCHYARTRLGLAALKQRRTVPEGARAMTPANPT